MAETVARVQTVQGIFLAWLVMNRQMQQRVSFRSREQRGYVHRAELLPP